ncbi:MAG: hypothetical protein ACKVUT_08030 [Gaiella sp.]
MERHRSLTEEECYLRCYGWVGQDDDVKVLDPRAEFSPEISALLAERMRREFEAGLEGRDAAAA